MTHQFYITLPSSSSMDLFPTNKTSSYKVHSIQLDPFRWEVALSEIHFLHSLYNVRENKNIMIKTAHHPSLKEEKSILPTPLKETIIRPSGSISSRVINTFRLLFKYRRNRKTIK